jgi:hypothetical protein
MGRVVLPTKPSAVPPSTLYIGALGTGYPTPSQNLKQRRRDAHSFVKIAMGIRPSSDTRGTRHA